MRDIAGIAGFQALAGQHVAVSDWLTITQQRIDTFADATDDHQWIHVDVERCARESPYGCTVAHGFLTLSLLPAMLAGALHMAGIRMAINYGLNKVRFPGPVPVNSRLRARLDILSVDDLPEGAQVNWAVTMEREGDTKPVCVAEFLMRCYP
ncbi:MaoC family dehydratase [Janthinobacterium lividum]|uniref:MaoC family dehydratase n=1 Tax=Janthinobacterium lividum TaxID=29581 RepID=UPI0005369D1E|nr:MaoC family dehydratase [Janthinobacterium lividum]KHA79377.1 dehydratase [Janthinobacterium lividum]QKY09723.1 MaoC family dehydratase [Janthinobacterium lividum]